MYATAICPKCESGTLEWSHFPATWDDPSDDEFEQSCSCILSDAELKLLEEAAWNESAAQEAAYEEDLARYYAELDHH